MSRTNKIFSLIVFSILAIFFISFIYQSALSMKQAPFHEFDEAHRAENAKQMKEHNSFFVPLTGSGFDRNIAFRIRANKDNPFNFLYYHLERPPLVYFAMVKSISLFGSIEWAYRLPSFLAGMASFGIFLFFAHKLVKKPAIVALSIGLLSLMASADLWLSAQYAQLDTALATSLFLALLSLIYYCQKRAKIYLFISSLGLALGILSKGQPAIIFTLPLLYLLFSKKLTFNDLIQFFFATLLFISPWLINLSWQFGFFNVIKTFFGFAFMSASQDEIHHLAPFFWYARWWWESLRPGWTFFIVLLAMNILNKSFDWRKKTLLFYILGGLITFSIPNNKLWWYVLPLVPALSFYIYLSLIDLLKKKKLVINLSLAIIIASMAPFSGIANKIAIFYGLTSTVVIFYIMMLDKLHLILSAIKFKKLWGVVFNEKVFFTFALLFSLISFYLRFPQIIPYDWNIKPVASFFNTLPERKCLWIYDMPPESVLFYSNAINVNSLNTNTKPFAYCDNYLITPAEVKKGELIFQQGNMKLFRYNDELKIF